MAKLIQQLTEEERRHIPKSFDEMVITYFDDGWIHADADDYESLLVRWKLILMACREAKIKFSAEKCSLQCGICKNFDDTPLKFSSQCRKCAKFDNAPVRSLSVSFFIEKELCKQLRMKRKRKGER